MVIMETERLYLREMTQEDFPALSSILMSDTVMYAYEGGFSLQEAQEWLDRQIQRYKDERYGLWAAVCKDTGNMIGQCGLTWQYIDTRRILEVGYIFHNDFWGHGYATEAARACRDFAFQQSRIEEVFSIIRDTNLASQKVALRNGMTARMRVIKLYKDVLMPHIVYSITRQEWEKLTALKTSQSFCHTANEPG